jgi:hypothetical protein
MPEEALYAVVDQVMTPILEHLPHDQTRRVADTFGFGARRLKPTQFLDHLVQQHDDIATHEETIEGVWVFDKSRGVGDVHRAG